MSAPPAGVERDYPLARLTTVRTGGAADWFARPGDEEELVEMLRWAEAEGLAVGLIGSGSNLLVADDGFHGLAIKLDGDLATIERDGERILCGGGARLPSAAAKAAGWGLSGLEFGINIPGTAGGAVRMNANAYGGQLARVLDWVEVSTAAGTERRAPEQLGFSYRRSNLRAGEVVSRASFRLRPGDPDAIRATLATMRERRREAQPSGIKTFGSTFKNPEDERAEGRSAGQLLEAAGCRGLRHGGARFSEKHANFVENTGDGDHRRRAGADGRGPAPGPRALRGRAGAGGPGAGRGALARAAGSCEARLLADRPAVVLVVIVVAVYFAPVRATTTVAPHARACRAGGDDRQRRGRGRGRRRRRRSSPGCRCPANRELPQLPLSEPPKGGRLAGPVLQQARVLGAAPAALRPYLASSYYGESGVDVETTSGIELRFGDASQAAPKWRAAAAVLADPDDHGARLCRPARSGAPGDTAALGIRFRPLPEPSTTGLGWAKSQVSIESLALQDACRPFDRGATMPYVQRNFRT